MSNQYIIPKYSSFFPMLLGCKVMIRKIEKQKNLATITVVIISIEISSNSKNTTRHLWSSIPLLLFLANHNHNPPSNNILDVNSNGGGRLLCVATAAIFVMKTILVMPINDDTAGHHYQKNDF